LIADANAKLDAERREAERLAAVERKPDATNDGG
jgi:hypothetical protein